MDFWKNKNLYLILDTSYTKPDKLTETAIECLNAGVDIIQFRDKHLTDREKIRLCIDIKKIAGSFNAPFIVNDRLDIALSCGADGVHLGQDDLSIDQMRVILTAMNRQLIIGLSTHSVEQAKKALDLNPDYIAIGPLYPTQTKPDYKSVGLDIAKEVAGIANIPLFGIGGVNISTIEQVKSSGIKRVAVVSAILLSENKKEVIASLKKILSEDL